MTIFGLYHIQAHCLMQAHPNPLMRSGPHRRRRRRSYEEYSSGSRMRMKWLNILWIILPALGYDLYFTRATMCSSVSVPLHSFIILSFGFLRYHSQDILLPSVNGSLPGPHPLAFEVKNKETCSKFSRCHFCASHAQVRLPRGNGSWPMLDRTTGEVR